MSDAADEADTTAVTVNVSALTPMLGRAGTIHYMASASVTVGSVTIDINGLSLRRERRHGLGAVLTLCAPQFRDPLTGQWRDAVTVPSEISHVIARALLSQAPEGGTLTDLDDKGRPA